MRRLLPCTIEIDIYTPVELLIRQIGCRDVTEGSFRNVNYGSQEIHIIINQQPILRSACPCRPCKCGFKGCRRQIIRGCSLNIHRELTVAPTATIEREVLSTDTPVVCSLWQ